MLSVLYTILIQMEIPLYHLKIKTRIVLNGMKIKEFYILCVDILRLKKHLTSFQIIIMGFAGVILAGAFLLMLPCSSTSGKITPFFDALFTSTSAVCVTGLVTIVPAEQFTLLGKIILMLLIQIGGLGIIACTVAFFSFSDERLL